MTTELSHNPFARTTIIRTTEHHAGSRHCSWCGASGRQLTDGRFRLYTYGVRADDDLRPFLKYGNLFCSISCWRSYCS